MSDTSGGAPAPAAEPTTPTGRDAAEVAAAVTGPGTPDNVTIKRGARQVLWAVFVALAVVVLGVAAVIAVLAYGPWWPNSEAVALSRVHGLKWIGWLLCGDIVLLVAAIAIPGGLGSVQASAGTNSLSLGGRP